MEFAPTDEDALIVQTVARWVDRELSAVAAEADRQAAVPAGLLAKAAALGFLLEAVPAAAGGMLEGRFSHVSRALRGVELGRGCGALGAVLDSNVEAALAVEAWADPATKHALWESLAAGRLASTAYDVGNALSFRPDGDDLLLDGELGPVPVVALADHLLLAASPRAPSPVLCLVALAEEDREALRPSAWRAAGWARLRFAGKRIGAAQVLARGPAAREAIAAVLSWYRVALAARAVGAATSAMRHAAEYGEERVQFGRPIGRFEALRRMRDEAETWTAAARALTLQAAWELDAGRASAADTASRARALAVEVVSRATIDAVQIFGGYGFVNDYPVEKLMRDARAFDAVLCNEGLERVLADADAE